VNDVYDLAYQPLAAGFVVGFLVVFFAAVLLGFVGWMKGLLG
jgi:hypothetical protein